MPVDLGALSLIAVGLLLWWMIGRALEWEAEIKSRRGK